jgi:hypothetical protein
MHIQSIIQKVGISLTTRKPTIYSQPSTNNENRKKQALFVPLLDLICDNLNLTCACENTPPPAMPAELEIIFGVLSVSTNRGVLRSGGRKQMAPPSIPDHMEIVFKARIHKTKT